MKLFSKLSKPSTKGSTCDNGVGEWKVVIAGVEEAGKRLGRKDPGDED